MRIQLAALLLLILAGCAQQPKKPDVAPLAKKPIPMEQSTEKQKPTGKHHPADQKWQQHQKQLSSLNHWQAEGRLAASNGGKGGNASFVWLQKGESYQVKLFGPWGAGSVHITGHPQFVELREANGKTTRAQSPEQLLKKVSGMQIPVTGLSYWLRGLPSPKSQSSAEQFNDQGYLKHLVQQGWNIHYENYQTQNSPALPSKLNLQNGKVKLKMIVTNWKSLSKTTENID